MKKFPRKIGWKAVDGRMFIIDTAKEGISTEEQLHEHIAKLRKDNGYEKPTFMTVHATNPVYQTSAESLSNATIDDINPEHREEVQQVILEGLDKPDPKTLN